VVPRGIAGILTATCSTFVCVLLVASAACAFGGEHAGVSRPNINAASVPQSEAGASRIQLADDDWEELPSDSTEPAAAHPDSGAAGADGTLDSSGHPQRGSNGAPVTIVEFGDFQCPYCKRAESTLREVRQHYGNKVRLIYMDFPLSFHANAMDAAIAGRCAGEQGRFWQYHDALFANQSSLSIPDLKSTAASLRLNTEKFDACLDQRKYESDVLADKAQGKRAGADGTPYFLINGNPLSGAAPFSAFEVAINRAMTQQSSQFGGRE
jgi:protein-disulfide isomerase